MKKFKNILVAVLMCSIVLVNQNVETNQDGWLNWKNTFIGAAVLIGFVKIYNLYEQYFKKQADLDIRLTKSGENDVLAHGGNNYTWIVNFTLYKNRVSPQNAVFAPKFLTYFKLIDKDEQLKNFANNIINNLDKNISRQTFNDLMLDSELVSTDQIESSLNATAGANAINIVFLAFDISRMDSKADMQAAIETLQAFEGSSVGGNVDSFSDHINSGNVYRVLEKLKDQL